jgi:hypothetical protein
MHATTSWKKVRLAPGRIPVRSSTRLLVVAKYSGNKKQPDKKQSDLFSDENAALARNIAVTTVATVTTAAALLGAAFPFYQTWDSVGRLEDTQNTALETQKAMRSDIDQTSKASRATSRASRRASSSC